MVTPKLTFVFDRKGQASAKKTGVVDLRISQGKVRKYISTGIQLFPKEWTNGSVVSRKDWKEVNDQLQVLKKKCSEIITKMMDEENLDLNAVPSLLKGKLAQQQTFIAYVKELGKKRFVKVASGTKEHYLLFFRFLEDWKGIVSFADITEKNVMSMDEELSSRGLKECTRWNYHKLLKSFVTRAVEDGLVAKNPYTRLDIKRGNESGLTRFLTPAEFHQLERSIIPTESLRKVRDLFVFQTYTMMAYSDLAAFDFDKCVKVGKETVYKAKRIKTGEDFTIVIMKPAMNILKRYDYKLPIISNVKYNLYLKAAVRFAKIEKPVTTHWARHTGATLLLNEGDVPMHIVQHILGHASIRETERTYAKVLDRSIVESMVNYEKRKIR